MPWLSRRLQFVLLAAVATTLAANLAVDAYQLARGTVREFADVRELVPAAQGEMTLVVVPESRRTVRERFLFFFGRTYYLVTYRIEIGNTNAIPPVDGRLVVDCARGRVIAFVQHPLLDPQPAAGPTDPGFRAERYRDALDPFATDLRLPPPGARLCAALTVVSRDSFVGGREVLVELGHPGGVLGATASAAVWTNADE